MLTAVGPYKLEGDKYLLNALASTPLETGAAGNFWMEIHINGLNEVPLGSLIIISFEDVYGHVITIQDNWTPSQ